MHASGHMLVANSAAMAKAGISAATPRPGRRHHNPQAGHQGA